MINRLKKNFFKISTILLTLLLGISVYFFIKNSGVKNIISLPSYSYTDLKEYGYDYISVRGTLVSDGKDGVASDLNTNEFICDRSKKTCELIQAEIFDDSLLGLYNETFDIESWDANFIVFKTLSENQSCVTWTWRIDRVKKELIGVREKASNYDFEKCMGIGLEKFTVKVVDGWEVIKKLRGYKE